MKNISVSHLISSFFFPNTELVNRHLIKIVHNNKHIEDQT